MEIWSAQVYPALRMEHGPRAIMDIRAQGLLTEQASGRASQVTRSQLRRATLSILGIPSREPRWILFLEVM
jgi:hypothetical protein